MTLYHGSNMAVVKPDLNFSRKNLDFGAGFYTTENKVQAVDFARKVMIRKGGKNQKASVYDFDMNTSEAMLDILRFQTPDRFVFKSDKALSLLKYVDSFEPIAEQLYDS